MSPELEDELPGTIRSIERRWRRQLLWDVVEPFVVVILLFLAVAGLIWLGYAIEYSQTWVCDTTFTPQANTWTTACGWR